jgi:repressor LexA
MMTVQMNSMQELTARQRQVLEFIEACRHSTGVPPSLREIAAHFQFQSMTAALDHVRALERKGFLTRRPRQARTCQVPPAASAASALVQVPIYGAIPAGPPRDQRQESLGCIAVDVQTLGVRPSSRTFALQVRGDSMIGKHILDRDYAIFEFGLTPRSGDVVAALIDNESTLKTFIMDRGKPYLRAENPRYPNLIPAQELVIQGVMVALIRKRT